MRSNGTRSAILWYQNNLHISISAQYWLCAVAFLSFFLALPFVCVFAFSSVQPIVLRLVFHSAIERFHVPIRMHVLHFSFILCVSQTLCCLVARLFIESLRNSLANWVSYGGQRQTKQIFGDMHRVECVCYDTLYRSIGIIDNSVFEWRPHRAGTAVA